MQRTALLCWEAGAGLGHATALRSVAHALEARGWRAVLALPADRTPRTFESGGIPLCEAPSWRGAFDPPSGSGSSASLGDLLAKIGLGRIEKIRRQLSGWLELFASHSPDLVIADYAPGAVLAARGRIPCLAVGTGFTVPPSGLLRFPPLHDLSPIAHDESATCAVVNAALAERSIPSIEALPEALRGDERCVRSFPLLDPYTAIRDEPVLGPLLNGRITRRAQDADEVFCYLREAPGQNRLGDIVGCLENLPVPVVAYLPGLDAARRDELRRSGVRILDEPAPLARQLERTRLVVHFGGHGLASAAVLAGVPQVITDIDVEKSLIAAALTLKGIARRVYYLDTTREVIRDGILDALSDSGMTSAARDAAVEHDRYSSRDVASEIATACEALVGGRGAVRRAKGRAKGSTVEGSQALNDPARTAGQRMTAGSINLDCYALHKHVPKLVPARVQRGWMDEFTDRHIYRCLPLAIANSFGWDMLCPVPIEIEWNGGPAIADLTVRALKPLPGGRPLEHFCKSHFSRGTVTFHTDYIFRTDPGWALMASGPFNTAKDNVVPLTGIVETDWLPYTFTMNWKLLRAGLATFEEDEPFCSIVPVQVQPILDCEPRIRWLGDNPELERQHEQFRASRDEFNAKKKAGHDEVRDQAWQRHYFVGRFPDGTKVEEHLNRLRLKEPVDLRSEEPPKPAAEIAPRTSLWADDSPMHDIGVEQSAENEAGRARLSPDGELADRSRAYVVSSAADAAACDFLVVEDLLSEDQCATIRKAFHDMEGQLFKSDKIDPYWNNRFLWYGDIARERPEAGAIMKSAQQRGLTLLRDFYKLTAPVFSDLLQIVRWQAGMFMRPHADNANPDGSPHGMPWRNFAAIAYVNDDYEGGELYFTALNMVVKPKRGMFVAFTGGFHHEHAVLKVKSGTRLTMPSFITFDRTRANPALMG